MKQEVARDKAHIDVGFWGGALPDNVKDLRPLHDAGVFGFKAFLSPSGVDEFPQQAGLLAGHDRDVTAGAPDLAFA